jgi:hypothetical protein
MAEERIRALVIPATTGPPYLAALAPTVEALQAAIGGGWLEAIAPRTGSQWVGWIDEEGKLKGLPSNALATGICEELGWPNVDDVLVGTVVLTGAAAPDVVDLPHAVTERIAALLPGMVRGL